MIDNRPIRDCSKCGHTGPDVTSYKVECGVVSWFCGFLTGRNCDGIRKEGKS